MLSDFLDVFYFAQKLLISHIQACFHVVNIAPHFFLLFCALVFEKTQPKIIMY